MPRRQVSTVRMRRQQFDTAQRAKGTIASTPATSYDAVELAELTTKARKSLKKSQFAVPKKRSKSGGSGGYPIPDEAHARNALSRVARFGTPTEKAQVRAAVKAKFPNIGKSTKSPVKKGGK